MVVKLQIEPDFRPRWIAPRFASSARAVAAKIWEEADSHKHPLIELARELYAVENKGNARA